LPGGVANVADRLREAREREGISIREISARTKIRQAALEALERGDFDRLPGAFYTRSFLKAYAREVGLPGEDVVREYDETFAPAQPEYVAPPVPAPLLTTRAPDRPPQPAIQRSPGPARVLRWPSRYNTPLALGLSVVLLVTLVSLSPTDPSRSVKAVAAGANGVAEAAPAAVATSGRVAVPDKLVIEIRPTAPIWVAATADGNSAIYRLLKPGERVMAEAQKELSFRIGNAGAFEYSINGVPGKPLGGPDEVREFEITLENYQTYRR
jgi:transcriptional regulator with XRE-family HTH domain